MLTIKQVRHEMLLKFNCKSLYFYARKTYKRCQYMALHIYFKYYLLEIKLLRA
jgi:hypothetical protein